MRFMRAERFVCLVSLGAVTLSGCGKKAEAPAAAAEGAAAVVAGPAAAGAVAPPTRAEAVPAAVVAALPEGIPIPAGEAGAEARCTAIIGAARDRFAPGVQITATGYTPDALLCNAGTEAGTVLSVNLDCRRGRKPADVQKKAKEDRQPEIAGIGRGAYGEDSDVTFFDNESDCLVTVRRYGEGTAGVEAAKVVEASLTAANAPKAPPRQPGEADLACVKLLPDSVRARFGLGENNKEEFTLPNTVECAFGEVVKSWLNLNVDCRVKMDDAQWAQYKEQAARMAVKMKSKFDEVAVGKYGHRMSGAVVFTDPESGCQVNVNWREEGMKTSPRTEELAKAIEKEMTKASVGL